MMMCHCVRLTVFSIDIWIFWIEPSLAEYVSFTFGKIYSLA